MVEQQTFNLLVVGSSPTGPTNTNMNQHLVDSITGLYNQSSNTEAKFKAAFDLLLEVMLFNKQITKRQYNKIKKLLDK